MISRSDVWEHFAAPKGDRMTMPRSTFLTYGFPGTECQARDFQPDEDSCTDEELAAHAAALRTKARHDGGCRFSQSLIACSTSWGIGGVFYRSMYRQEQRRARVRRQARKQRRGWA